MLRDEMEWVEKVVAIAVGGFKDEIESLKGDIKELKSTIKSLSDKPEPAPAKSKAEASNKTKGDV